jgi:hypothetical protein
VEQMVKESDIKQLANNTFFKAIPLSSYVIARSTLHSKSPFQFIVPIRWKEKTNPINVGFYSVTSPSLYCYPALQ